MFFQDTFFDEVFNLVDKFYYASPFSQYEIIDRFYRVFGKICDLAPRWGVVICQV